MGAKLHMFYKCPPEMVGESALEPYLLTPEQYVHSFNLDPKPVTGAPRNWYSYVENLLRNYPFEPMSFPLESMGLPEHVFNMMNHLREELQAALGDDSNGC